MSKPNEKVPRSISFTKELLKRIDDEAERQRRNRSDFVRIVLEDYLNQRARDKQQPTAAAA